VTTKLDGTLRREVDIVGTPYTLTLSPEGMALVRKGKRKGFEMRWTALVSGDAALATALNASLTANLKRADQRTQGTMDDASRQPAGRKRR
jgi:hypothetical protein